MGEIILEHVDQVFDVSEGVINNNIHFERVKSNPNDQMSNTAKSIQSTLYHHVSGMMWLSIKGEEQRAQISVTGILFRNFHLFSK